MSYYDPYAMYEEMYGEEYDPTMDPYANMAMGDPMQAAQFAYMGGDPMFGDVNAPAFDMGQMQAMANMVPDYQLSGKPLTASNQTSVLNAYRSAMFDPQFMGFGGQDAFIAEAFAPQTTVTAVDSPINDYLRSPTSVEGLIANELLEGGTPSTALRKLRQLLADEATDPALKEQLLMELPAVRDINGLPMEIAPDGTGVDWDGQVRENALRIGEEWAEMPPIGEEGPQYDKDGELISQGGTVDWVDDPTTGVPVLMRSTTTLPVQAQKYLEAGLPSPFDEYTPEDFMAPEQVAMRDEFTASEPLVQEAMARLLAVPGPSNWEQEGPAGELAGGGEYRVGGEPSVGTGLNVGTSLADVVTQNPSGDTSGIWNSLRNQGLWDIVTGNEGEGQPGGGPGLNWDWGNYGQTLGTLGGNEVANAITQNPSGDTSGVWGSLARQGLWDLITGNEAGDEDGGRRGLEGGGTFPDNASLIGGGPGRSAMRLTPEVRALLAQRRADYQGDEPVPPGSSLTDLIGAPGGLPGASAAAAQPPPSIGDWLTSTLGGADGGMSGYPSATGPPASETAPWGTTPPPPNRDQWMLNPTQGATPPAATPPPEMVGDWLTQLLGGGGPSTPTPSPDRNQWMLNPTQGATPPPVAPPPQMIGDWLTNTLDVGGGPPPASDDQWWLNPTQGATPLTPGPAQSDTVGNWLTQLLGGGGGGPPPASDDQWWLNPTQGATPSDDGGTFGYPSATGPPQSDTAPWNPSTVGAALQYLLPGGQALDPNRGGPPTGAIQGILPGNEQRTTARQPGEPAESQPRALTNAMIASIIGGNRAPTAPAPAGSIGNWLTDTLGGGGGAAPTQARAPIETGERPRQSESERTGEAVLGGTTNRTGRRVRPTRTGEQARQYRQAFDEWDLLTDQRQQLRQQSHNFESGQAMGRAAKLRRQGVTPLSQVLMARRLVAMSAGMPSSGYLPGT